MIVATRAPSSRSSTSPTGITPTLLRLFDEQADEWILPWAILPEVDYLVGAHLGAKAHEAWLDDLASGAFQIEWGSEADLPARGDRASGTARCASVSSTRSSWPPPSGSGQKSIATLDLRHFGAVALRGTPRLLPRDL